MNLSRLFILRPVATTLLTLGLFLLMLVILWNSCRKGKTYFNVTRLDFSEM